MEVHKVVPDVIDSVPSLELSVEYPDGSCCQNGNMLKPSQVHEAPKVTWDAEPSELFALIMTDPDPPIPGEIKHWVILNIPGSNIDKGFVVADYIGSRPPKDSGAHRYVFLLYKQESAIPYAGVFSPKTSREGRLHFNVREFAATHNLGQPVAGNFYRAEYEPFVDEQNARDAATKL